MSKSPAYFLSKICTKKTLDFEGNTFSHKKTLTSPYTKKVHSTYKYPKEYYNIVTFRSMHFRGLQAQE